MGYGKILTSVLHALITAFVSTIAMITSYKNCSKKNKIFFSPYLSEEQAVAKWESGQMYPVIAFRFEANVNIYAAYANETESTRLDSHDFTYSNGSYTYHDTYIGRT